MRKTHDIAFFLLLAFTMFVMICGCTRTIYTTIESTHTDSIATAHDNITKRLQTAIETLQQTSRQRDSVIIRDSVIMVVNQQGEVITKEVYHDREHSAINEEAIINICERYDSILSSQRDEFVSILQDIQQVPVPVDKPLSMWEKFITKLGYISFGLIIVAVLAIVIWLIRLLRKRGS